MIHLLYRKALRVLLAGVQIGRSTFWALARPEVRGAHVIAFTPAGRFIFVKLSYARGWHLAGGGRKAGESAEENALRELREEIGMQSYGTMRLAFEIEEPVRGRLDHASIFIIEDVIYRPNRWSIEIEQVIEADPHHLPPGLSRRARRWIVRAGLAEAEA